LIARDPLLASLDGRDRDLLFPSAGTGGIKYPGFYVHDPRAGTLIPQFQPLYPALLAAAIGIFGDRAALYVNPTFAIASLLLLFHLACAWRGRAFALAAAALLAFNVVQVWNSRFSTSEMTAQVILLAGFAFLEDFLTGGDAAAGALSGLAFGMAPMATVTTVLVLPFALAAALWPGGEEARAGRWAFAVALAVALSHLVLWSVFVDPKYIAQVTRFFPEPR
jgi:4-amino-4-deoxy-L-arabinose transferase-like glycosyltransferase